jgi:hypothetical protein
MFNNFFPKIIPFMRLMWKNMVDADRSQKTYNTAYAHCVLDT